MSLDRIRREIDILDARITELLMQRLNLAEEVVQTKIDAGIHDIYLAAREEDIMTNVSQGIPEDRQAVSLALIRKMVEISRTHQYEILCAQVSGLLDAYLEDVEMPTAPKTVRIEMIRPNVTGEMGAVCSTIGDSQFNILEVKRMDNSIDDKSSRLWFTIAGDINDPKLQVLLTQLAQESEEFSILSVD